MPRYIIICNTCSDSYRKKLNEEKREMTDEEYEEMVLFETAHSIKADDETIAAAMICPRCNGSDCSKTLPTNIVGYVRGDGYLDKAGATRDMHICHLTEQDPYAEYRMPGEVDELKSQLKKAGRHKPKSKYYDMFGASASMKQAVSEAVQTPLSDS